jgi:hypothetical protein
MKLNQALAIINARKDSTQTEVHYLACGFEPLHLATLLRAHLLERLPNGKNIEIQFGVYGDLRGNIESATRSSALACSVVLEWSDLDPRLGLRSSGGWSNEAKSDILASSRDRWTPCFSIPPPRKSSSPSNRPRATSPSRNFSKPSASPLAAFRALNSIMMRRAAAPGLESDKIG